MKLHFCTERVSQSPRRPEYATKARAIAKTEAYVVSRREKRLGCCSLSSNASISIDYD